MYYKIHYSPPGFTPTVPRTLTISFPYPLKVLQCGGTETIFFRKKGSNHRRLKSGGVNLLLRLRQPTLNFQQVLEEGRVAISKHFCGFRRPVVGIRQPVVGIRLTAAELRSCVYIQLSVSNFGFSDKL